MAITSPSDISGLVLDLDPHIEAYEDAAGTTPATVGNPVGNVPDQQGLADAVVQSTTSQKPTLQEDANGWRYLDFDGVDDLLRNETFLPTTGGAQPFEIVVVAQAADTASAHPYIADGSSFHDFRQRPGDYQLRWGTNLRGGTPDSGIQHIFFCIVDGSSGAVLRDTTVVASGNVGTDAWTTGVEVGSQSSNAGNVDVWRAFVFDRLLTSTERTDLYDYLNGLYSNPAPGGGTTVEADGLVQTQVLGSPSISQTHVLTPSGLVQAQVLGSPSVTTTTTVTPDGLVQVQVLGSPSITQDHQLTPSGLVQTQVLGSPSIEQDHQITLSGLVQEQVLGSPEVSIVLTVTPGGLIQAQVLGSPAITQTHLLTPGGLVQVQVLGSPTITQNHQITLSGLLQQQVLADLSVSVTGSAVFGGGTPTARKAVGGTPSASLAITGTPTTG